MIQHRRDDPTFSIPGLLSYPFADLLLSHPFADLLLSSDDHRAPDTSSDKLDHMEYTNHPLVPAWRLHCAGNMLLRHAYIIQLHLAKSGEVSLAFWTLFAIHQLHPTTSSR